MFVRKGEGARAREQARVTTREGERAGEQAGREGRRDEGMVTGRRRD